MLDERVLVFHESVLETCRAMAATGIIRDDIASGYGRQIFFDSLEKPFFKDRHEAETDETIKQIIPYIVIRLSTDGDDKYLVYQRSKASGESRLLGQHSVGIGGHVNEQDCPSYNKNDPHFAVEAFFNCIRRELDEELDIELHPGFDIVGILDDPSNPVGRVHFGFIVEVQAKNGVVKAIDPAISDPHFVTAPQLIGMHDKLENWSKMALDVILKGKS